jgi:hypothetical protein
MVDALEFSARDWAYAAFGIGWDDMAGVDQRGRELARASLSPCRDKGRMAPSGILPRCRQPKGTTIAAKRRWVGSSTRSAASLRL